MDLTLLPWLQPLPEKFRQQKIQRRTPQAVVIPLSLEQGAADLCQAIAQHLLCDASTEAPCKKCKSCLLAEHDHTDFIEIRPEGQWIKVDQIRELAEKVLQPTQVSQYRIVYFEQADTLNVAAANALLKTLEEPESKTLFLLQTHKASLLPATILSRCQMATLPKPTIEEQHDWLLQQDLNIDVKELPWMLSVCGGLFNLRDVIKNNKLDEVRTLQQLWILGLKQGMAHSELIKYTKAQPVQSLAMLYRLLKMKLEKISNKPLQSQLLIKLTYLVSQKQHALSQMPTINYTALCQFLLNEYKRAIAEDPTQ